MRENWTYKKLGEVCNILNGFAFKSGNYTGQGIRVMRITNVQKGLIVDDDPKYYPLDEEQNIEQYMLKEDDLLMSLTGNVGRVGLLQKELLPAALNQRVACIRITFNDILLKYVFHFLNSDSFERDCIFNATGIAQKNMSTEWLKKYIIPVPSLSEQQSIVAELDKINELISLKKAQLSDLDALAQSIFYDMFGDPVENEKGWEVKKLQEVCLKITDGTHNSPVNTDKGDYMYVTAKNIKKDGIITDNITYVSADIHKIIYERCNPKYGDVLYIKDGVTTGIATINTLKEEFSLLSSVALLKPNNNVINHYLKAVLNFPSQYASIRENMGGAAITRLTIVKIKTIRIPVPPLPLQQSFAARITAIEQQKQRISASIKDLETLLASRMQYWFD